MRTCEHMADGYEPKTTTATHCAPGPQYLCEIHARLVAAAAHSDRTILGILFKARGVTPPPVEERLVAWRLQ